MEYEYRMIQAAPAVQASKVGPKGQEAAKYLERVVNEGAVDGWEFYRMDSLSEHRPAGCLGIGQPEVNQYYVVTFRRPKAVAADGDGAPML
jgi:hypothetical protein